MATKSQIVAGRAGRAAGFEYERDLVKTISTFGYTANEYPQYQASKVGNRQSRAKTDIVISNGVVNENISIKSPKNHNTSIQMQIVPRTTVNEILSQQAKLSQDYLEFCDLFFGGRDIEHHADAAGIDFSSLDYESEQRRLRLRANSIPRSVVDGALEFLNRKDIKSAVLRMVLSEGNVASSEAHARKMLWCDTRVHGKSNLEEAIVVDIEELVSSISNKFDWTVLPSETVLRIGPVTLQMKGSGAKGGSSYHSLQFNASIKDIISDCPESVLHEGSLGQAVSAIFS